MPRCRRRHTSNNAPPVSPPPPSPLQRRSRALPSHHHQHTRRRPQIHLKKLRRCPRFRSLPARIKMPLLRLHRTVAPSDHPNRRTRLRPGPRQTRHRPGRLRHHPGPLRRSPLPRLRTALVLPRRQRRRPTNAPSAPSTHLENAPRTARHRHDLSRIPAPLQKKPCREAIRLLQRLDQIPPGSPPAISSNWPTWANSPACTSPSGPTTR